MSLTETLEQAFPARSREDSVDMCIALDNRIKKENIIKVVEAYKDIDMPEEEIFDRVSKKFGVTKDDISNILSDLVCS